MRRGAYLSFHRRDPYPSFFVRKWRSTKRSPFPMTFHFLLLILGEGGNSRDGTRSAGLPFGARFVHAAWNLHAVRKEAMNDVSRQSHWDNVYATKGESEVSWFEETPALSLELIRLVGAIQNSGIIDIGGGASRLADCLVSQGYQDVSVLDLSAAALASARSRIGDNANQVTWI